MKIVRAAVKRGDGVVFTGHRHHNVFNDYRPLGGLKGGEQGFVTDTGAFVNREEAARIAFEAGQIPEPKRMLFSEDIY